MNQQIPLEQTIQQFIRSTIRIAQDIIILELKGQIFQDKSIPDNIIQQNLLNLKRQKILVEQIQIKHELNSPYKIASFILKFSKAQHSQQDIKKIVKEMTNSNNFLKDENIKHYYEGQQEFYALLSEEEINLLAANQKAKVSIYEKLNELESKAKELTIVKKEMEEKQKDLEKAKTDLVNLKTKNTEFQKNSIESTKKAKELEIEITALKKRLNPEEETKKFQEDLKKKDQEIQNLNNQIKDLNLKHQQFIASSQQTIDAKDKQIEQLEYILLDKENDLLTYQKQEILQNNTLQIYEEQLKQYKQYITQHMNYQNNQNQPQQ